MFRSLLPGFAALAMLLSVPAHAGDSVLVSWRVANHHAIGHLDSMWREAGVPRAVAPVRYAVTVYELVFHTEDARGRPALGSGLYYVPEGVEGPVPAASFNYGSRSTPRVGAPLESEAIIACALAGDGYAVCLPDYLGLGVMDTGGRGPVHPYHHAATEAEITLDMLRAAREANPRLGMAWDGHLFLSGYSQGGHAAMATHKAIEERHADEFPLTASAPLSGAYDLAGVQVQSMFRSYPRAGYFAFLARGMNAAYGLFDDWTDALRPAYADTLDRMLASGAYDLEAVSAVMPDTPVGIIKPEIVAAFFSDTANPFRRALEANALTDWAPERPMMLCYCKGDEEVDYRNALVAQKRMTALGSDAVRLRRAGVRFGHEACAPFAAIYAKLYFDSFLRGKEEGGKGRLGPRMLIGLGRWFSPADG